MLARVPSFVFWCLFVCLIVCLIVCLFDCLIVALCVCLLDCLIVSLCFLWVFFELSLIFFDLLFLKVSEQVRGGEFLRFSDSRTAENAFWVGFYRFGSDFKLWGWLFMVCGWFPVEWLSFILALFYKPFGPGPGSWYFHWASWFNHLIRRIYWWRI